MVVTIVGDQNAKDLDEIWHAEIWQIGPGRECMSIDEIAQRKASFGDTFVIPGHFSYHTPS